MYDVYDKLKSYLYMSMLTRIEKVKTYLMIAGIQ